MKPIFDFSTCLSICQARFRRPRRTCPSAPSANAPRGGASGAAAALPAGDAKEEAVRPSRQRQLSLWSGRVVRKGQI